MDKGGRKRTGGDPPSRRRYSCPVCSISCRSDALKRHYSTLVARDPDTGLPLTENNEKFRDLDSIRKKHTKYFSIHHNAKDSYPQLEPSTKPKKTNPSNIQAFFTPNKRKRESNDIEVEDEQESNANPIEEPYSEQVLEPLNENFENNHDLLVDEPTENNNLPHDLFTLDESVEENPFLDDNSNVDKGTSEKENYDKNLLNEVEEKMRNVLGISELKTFSNIVYDSVLDALEEHKKIKKDSTPKSIEM